MGDEVRSSSAGSFAPQTAGVVFDLAKETDALAVLKSVHRSAIDVDTKNALRDAVFEYRNNFDQAALVHACELFASVGMNVVGCVDVPATTEQSDGTRSEAVSASAPVSRFGNGRRSAFGRSTSPTAQKSEPAKVQLKVTPPVEPPPPPEPEPMAAPVAVVEPEPAPAPAPEPKPVVSPAPEPAQEVVSTPAPAVATTVKPVDRINEIKKLINDRVGNPVNLIEAHNEMGREYMNALLEAMKKSNGGQSAEVAAAMARLETAFSAVMSVLDTPASAPIPEPAPVPPVEPAPLNPPTPEPEPVSATVPQPPAPAPVGPAPQPIPEPVPVAAVIEPPTPAAPEVPVTPFTPVKPLTTMASDSAVAKAAAAGWTHVTPSEPVKTPEMKEEKPATPPEPIAAPAEFSVAAPQKVVSVAKAKQVEELMHKQFVEAAEREAQAKKTAEEKMDPVMVSEVTVGLRQLLSEWSLFKSSGLFGTGPAGIDHPLYKKINNLPMQAVIAGRFEGSTPQIRQSISDYMNGWRYEEGVVFDYGETFEHYLRRVIRHILDKKQQKAAAAKPK